MNQQIIFWDVGGVIAADMHGPLLDWLAATRYPSVPEDTFRHAAEPVWRQFAVDPAFSEEEFWRHLLDAFKFQETIDDLKTLIRERQFKVFWGAMAVAERLCQRNYPIGIISNHSKPWFTELVERFRLFDVFSADLTTTSFQVGVSKPDAKIYKIAYDKAKSQYPQTSIADCVFMDDKEKNVEAATAFGMSAFQFDVRVDPISKLVTGLNTLGVDAAEK